MASVSYTISELADRIGATVHGDPNCIIQGVNSLAQAKSGELSFLLGGAYRRLLPSTKASVVVLSEQDLPNCPVNAIVTSNPELGFTKLLHLFHSPPQHASGQHSTAVLGKETQLAEGVSIGAHCVIGDRVSIGANTVIAPGCQIGDDVVIGAGTYLYSNVTVYHCVQIGNRVILHSGAVIGSDGFGLTNDQGQWVKIPQVGTVVIEDDVEVGANSVIDRGALENTLIEQGVKIDNLVQIAHNVRIGAHSVIAGCTGISGSVQIGRHCIVGGGACINGHITLADQVVITGMAMVTHSITEPGVYSSGTGIQNNREWRKSAVRFQQLDKLAKRVQHIERMVDE